MDTDLHIHYGLQDYTTLLKIFNLLSREDKETLSFYEVLHVPGNLIIRKQVIGRTLMFCYIL